MSETTAAATLLLGAITALERDPARRRELVAQLFERVWIDERRVVAVRPMPAFAPFFVRRPGMRGIGEAGKAP